MNQRAKDESLAIFDRLESEVRSYVRSFPVLFDRGVNTTLTAADGQEYLDFFGGAGALNYGHNNPAFKQALLDYIERDGIVHSLDLATTAKKGFIETFERCILKPRGLNYKLQFTGPTGANAVEAALKLARQVTRRSNIVSFTGSYHGVSAGSLAATAHKEMRAAAGFPLAHVTSLPYEGYLGDSVDTIEYFEKLLNDPNSGLDKPAAVILEAVQGEGGIVAASVEWLRRLRDLTSRHEILLILDDIQAGIGRTGKFFSFEAAGIVPDIVTLSKSLSAYGTPMALVLFKPELDVWTPAAHTGTFRGNNLAFVTGRAALEAYWSDSKFEDEIARKSAILAKELKSIASDYPELELSVRGRGLMYGLVSPRQHSLPALVSREAFSRRLILETAGSFGEVLKFMPALTITEGDLRRGLTIIRESVHAVQDRMRTSVGERKRTAIGA
ncbi:diaminobutyrate--2-oxoglutarate transaminase [Mesorhizobium sp.]|uniref:diaminobutyrate--2-oxoglutarate transaminase n=1 Tax=Mesorhizobium sp. TaxID=1871066 RepID=UPI000FE7240D|nr:diaminobutyrate--2-oxoglutarate transaminase [Mesorhizobium sp.]RWF86839.1 MAG: diaminobutyrate--2-oxoglutarate transaminase [Mesorhizobium sp.]RWF89769.1 MAG: diaminobutyrate--2-oxoglutarate transaminase [Mesorhizobium sp.]RWJ55701.1 MAG: diaminobutyrate--2-oxoglutarate transaminase [Mesorhizobium sp.]RWJ63158.1 MAG: diaminobutyrate--2-oxoglutarate transaminase [Mesorhizobium sp.]RWJ91200.1 MAG: diaminobutyrate--2-oxoglutarate transaminase [Mesorhizobium sp.]